VIFSVETDGRELFRSPMRCSGDEPMRVAVTNPPASDLRTLELRVGDAGDGPSFDHADWADAIITLRSGRTLRLDELPQARPPYSGARYPFSFTYDNKSSDACLPAWRFACASTNAGDGVTALWRTWTDQATGFRVRWEGRSHQGYPDAEWVLYFENTGNRDTPIVEGI
jgi:alpha-galactosidase